MIKLSIPPTLHLVPKLFKTLFLIKPYESANIQPFLIYKNSNFILINLAQRHIKESLDIREVSKMKSRV